MAGRGRGAVFIPTEEQRRQVSTLASLGIPQHEIRNVIYWNDKPIGERTLQRKFKEELTTSHTKLKAQVGALFMASVLGRAAPQGTKAITKQASRAHMMEFYLKNQAGWSDRVSHEGGDPKRPIILQTQGADRDL